MGCGAARTGSISGLVWRDSDGDGQQDDGEPVLADQVVYLDTNRDGDKDDGEPERTTDDDGRYLFEQLRPGQYVVRHVVQEGWEQTHPGAGGATAFTYTGSDAALFMPGDIQFPGIAPAQLAARLDVNGDGYLSPVDVLLIVNALNAEASGDGRPGRVAARQRPAGRERRRVGKPRGCPDRHQSDQRLRRRPDPTPAAPPTRRLGICNPAISLIGLDALRADPRFADLDGQRPVGRGDRHGHRPDHAFFGPDADGDGVADRIVFQYDFADGDADAGDVSGHGSHVSSIIASQDSTYPGVAPGVDVIHLKVFSDTGQGNFAYLEQALQWVIQNVDTYQIAAVNLSLGDGQNWSQPVGLYGVADELAALDALGVITVSAAGNSYAIYGGREGLAYPAADPHSLAVGAVWDSDRGWQTFGATGPTTPRPRIASPASRSVTRRTWTRWRRGP